MGERPCRLLLPARMYEHLVAWPGGGSRCLGEALEVPAWVPAEVLEACPQNPRRALVRARYAGRHLYCWMREGAQFDPA